MVQRREVGLTWLQRGIQPLFGRRLPHKPVAPSPHPSRRGPEKNMASSSTGRGFAPCVAKKAYSKNLEPIEAVMRGRLMLYSLEFLPRFGSFSGASVGLLRADIHSWYALERILVRRGDAQTPLVGLAHGSLRFPT